MTDAKKSLGQHWLKDESALQAMVEAGQVEPKDLILEVGPGKGALTQKLLDKGAEVLAVELDESLVRKLKERFAGKKLSIINENILKFNFLSIKKPYKLVANIPYYISGKLIRQLIDLKQPPEVITMLVQKEVAERLVARPGKLSILGVLVQLKFKVELGRIVPPSSFDPPPKVDSQIVKLLPIKPSPVLPGGLVKLVKLGFASRRKTLLNNLSAGLQLDKLQLIEELDATSLSKNVRAQELSLDIWIDLAKRLKVWL